MKNSNSKNFDMKVFSFLFFLFLMSIGLTAIIGLNNLIPKNNINYFIGLIITTSILLIFSGTYYQIKYKGKFL